MLKTALIVDDSRLARLTLKRLLTQYDIQVSEAEGVVDAERWIQHNLMPDMVFMDVMMPEIDGFEGLERMRANPETRHVPVIMYSGDISEEARKKARDHGATGYLPKPADANRLDHLLNALNKRSKPTQIPAAAPTPPVEKAKPAKPANIYGKATSLSGDSPFELTQENFAPAHQTFEEAPPPRAAVREAPREAEMPVLQESAMPITPAAAALSPEILSRLNDLEARLNAAQQAGRPSAPSTPPEVAQRLNRLEEKLSAQSSNAALLDFSADVERQRLDVIYLQRQVAKSEQLGKVAVGLAALGLLIALAAVIRSML